jgi:hypothetical protein
MFLCEKGKRWMEKGMRKLPLVIVSSLLWVVIRFIYKYIKIHWAGYLKFILLLLHLNIGHSSEDANISISVLFFF